MASHHHHQQTHHHSSTCYSCCCSCSSPYQPQISPTDPLVQAIATQLLHQQQSQQQQVFTHYLSQPQPHQHHHHHHQPKKQHQPKKHHHHHHDQEQEQAEPLITSLVRRISALETSLHTLSHSPPPPSSSSSSSLRDLAARTIQTHFRAYLVRRSQTLRHLKHLAIIKSSFTSLKSSVSTKPHFNSEAISQKAMDLLLKLDYIQGGDPMIRDGKRAIRRELVQFLEFVDGVSKKRQQLCSKPMRKVRFVRDVEESRVCKGTHDEPFSSENVSEFDEQGVGSDDQVEVMENLCKKIENIEGFTRVYEEECQSESDGSSSSSSKLSNGERNPRNNLKSRANSGNSSHFQGQNGKFMFSAPLPVQMESIVRDEYDDETKREKIVRVAR